jgi:hypothetical protein
MVREGKDFGNTEEWSDEDEVHLRKEAGFVIARPLYMTARISKEERQEIKKQAAVFQLTLSEYVRRRALGKSIVPQADLIVLAELRRLEGLLKRVHLEARGKYSEPTEDAIRAIESYVQTLEQSRKEKEDPA